MRVDEKFDCIVVGAGPAGIAAAFTLAKAGLQVVVLERGERPGSKNVMGGVLYSTILNKLVPEFWKEAPVERHVVRKKFSLLGSQTETAFLFSSEAYNVPPYNNSFTVLRGKFDEWFAKKAEEAGAMVFPGVVVDDLISENGKIAGVRCRGEGGELRADCVICAEGANSLLVRKLGLRPKFESDKMVVGVKEVLGLPREVIEDRFALDGDEGCDYAYFGDAVQGSLGGGFIYTNKDSLSVGIACSIRSVEKQHIRPFELIEHFKNHPCVRNLLRGGELLEYSAHMIPEGGVKHVTKLHAPGFLVVGDAAGFVNPSFYHEGSNLAMASGVMAAETVIEAKKKGDFSDAVMQLYKEKLDSSFVMKDLKKFSRIPEFGHKNPELFQKYPNIFGDLLTELFAVSETPKSEVQKDVVGRFRKNIGLLRFGRKLWQLMRAAR
ncbi:MAG: FAD-dependent oxidoreductase [Candidatus Eisenbacteria bacterium]|nr:FAD-dependent oxidoreductase [Candidatus Eisenbacteria bacterium]